GELPWHPPQPADPGQHQLPALDADGIPAGVGRPGGDPGTAGRHVRPRPHVQPGFRHLRAGRARAPVRPVHRPERRDVADLVAGSGGGGGGPAFWPTPPPPPPRRSAPTHRRGPAGPPPRRPLPLPLLPPPPPS